VSAWCGPSMADYERAARWRADRLPQSLLVALNDRSAAARRHSADPAARNLLSGYSCSCVSSCLTSAARCGGWTPYRWPSEIGRFSAPLVYVSRTEISCTSPQCGHLTLSVALQAARRLRTSLSMPVGACWCVVGQVKNREDICGSFPCTGGSATGLSATDAWRRAAVGDEGRLRLFQSRVCRKAPYTYALKQRAARWSSGPLCF
jgi:hypothetical protein